MTMRVSSFPIGVTPERLAAYVAEGFGGRFTSIPDVVPTPDRRRRTAPTSAPTSTPTRPAARNVRAPTPRASTPRAPATPRAAQPEPACPGYHARNGEFLVIGEVSERTAASLERDLGACAGVGVTVTVDSPGGDLLAGIRIANAVREHGQASAVLKRADSAALAFVAAKTVRVVEGVSYLLHQPVVEIPHSVAVSGPEMHEAADAMARNFATFSRALEPRISDGLFRLLAAEDRRLTAIEWCSMAWRIRL